MRRLKTWYNTRYPYHRVCMGPWYCWRGQTNQHRCHRHQNLENDKPIWYVQEHTQVEEFGAECTVVWESARMPKKYAEDLLSEIAYKAARTAGDNWFSLERDDD